MYVANKKETLFSSQVLPSYWFFSNATIVPFFNRNSCASIICYIWHCAIMHRHGNARTTLFGWLVDRRVGMKPVKLPIGTAAGLVRIAHDMTDATPSVIWCVRIHRIVEMYPDFGLVCVDGDRKVLLLCREDLTWELEERLRTNGVDPEDEYAVCVQPLGLERTLATELHVAMPEEAILECARVLSIQRTHTSDLRKRPLKIAQISFWIAIIIALYLVAFKVGAVLYELFFKPRTGDYHQLTDGIGMLVGFFPASLLLFCVVGATVLLVSFISNVYTS